MSETEHIDLAPVIAQSRQTDAIFNINTTISADVVHMEDVEHLYKAQEGSSNLSSAVLQELLTKQEEEKHVPPTKGPQD